MPPFLEHRTSESPVEIEAAGQIVSLISRGLEILEKIPEIDPCPPRSMLAADNALLQDAFPVSDYALSNLTAAGAHLHALQELIVVRTANGGTSLSANYTTPYAVIRAIFESAAAVLWVLTPDSCEGRCERRLRMLTEDAKNAKRYRQEIDAEKLGTDERCTSPSCDQPQCSDREHVGAALRAFEKHFASYFRRIGELAISAGSTPKAASQKRTSSGILSDAQSSWQEPATGVSWLGGWQLCSGFAHSKDWSTLRVSDLTEQGQDADRASSTYIVEINYVTLNRVLESAVSLTQAAVSRYASLARPRF